MTAHTPGPWEVGASGVSPLAVCTGHRVLAQVNVTGYKCAAAEDTANARLIAAIAKATGGSI